MSFLSGKRCYLSGPIEQCTAKENWRVPVKKILTERFGIDVFDPFDDPKQQWVPSLNEARANCDYDEMAKISRNFVRKDLAMVDRADFICAQLPYRVATCGSHHEIINSVNAKKPTLLVCPEGKQFLPLWYYGFIPHEVMFGSWDDLFSYLQDVEDGKHKDNNRWAFVYGLV